MTSIADPLTLPCGLVLKNRLAKAAMTEQLCKTGEPHERLVRLYERFASGGVGLMLTGNAMVERDQREHPRNLVVDQASDADAYRRLANAAGDTAFIVQLSHPGRQAVYARPGPVAPSPIALQGLGPVFRKPRELTIADIAALVARFIEAARFVSDRGFHGVQVHGAHGYLISQFLSPRANLRTDAYGGSLENRARFLLEIVEGIRRELPRSFAVSVKLNSADFQKGGFGAEDALEVIAWLAERRVDLLEISGGSYEAPAMVGLRASTVAREAYFLEFAERAAATNAGARRPLALMVTGGFRTPAAMNAALASGATSIIGLARPLALEPDLPRRLLEGDDRPAKKGRDRLGVRFLDSVLASQFYVENLHRLADGREPSDQISRAFVLAHTAWMLARA